MKAAQAGEFCFCPDCENEIQIPLESALKPPKQRKKKRRGERKPQIEIDLSPKTVVGNTKELDSRLADAPTIVSAPVNAASTISAKGVSPPIDVGAESPSVSFVDQAELRDSSADAAFGDAEELDSKGALDQLLSSDEREIPDDNSAEADSFLLAKPVAKIGADPLKANPDLVWYLRHKRLGEKGPLRARQIEEMLEAGQIRAGHIVWREDWNDWVPAEDVFPSLAQSTGEAASYEIPDDLNPHSEASRKRRAKKRFWMCFNAAAFLLVIVLVYWITQFGSS